MNLPLSDANKTRSDAFRYVEIINTSLREFLVTEEEWFKEIESAEGLSVAVLGQDASSDYYTDIHGNMHKKSLWLLPYPYGRSDSIFAMMAEEHMPGEEMSVAESRQWAKDVCDRVSRLYQYAIPEELLSEIDNDYDTGVVISASTGRYFTFNYTALKSVDFYQFSYQHFSTFLRWIKSSGDGSDLNFECKLDMLLDDIKEMGSYYSLYVAMQEKDEQEIDSIRNDVAHYFHMSICRETYLPDHEPISLTVNDLFNVETLRTIYIYMMNAVELHAKCIVLP